MTDYIRDLPVKIVTVAAMKKIHGRYKSHVGWKVYINGAKFPEKPLDYYTFDEETAIGVAIVDYKARHGL